MALVKTADILRTLPIDISERIARTAISSFKLKDSPIYTDPVEIIGLYSGIQEGVECFQKALREDRLTSEQKKWFVEDYSLENLAVTEGQASWVVLRRFEDDKRIHQYPRDQRLACFIEKLYENREKFIFFNSRKNALEQLDGLGIIKMGEYEP